MMKMMNHVDAVLTKCESVQSPELHRANGRNDERSRLFSVICIKEIA